MKTVQHGILLKRIDYSETSLIVQFFTLENGFQAFIFQGGKKKKGNLLYPLSLMEITAYHRGDSSLGKITEINPAFVPQTIPFDPLKSGLVFFMAEVLAQLIQKSDKDPKIYEFVEREIKWLDNSEELTNYPIWFLLKLAEITGIGIQVEHPNGLIFNLQEGTISNHTPSTHLFVKNESASVLADILTFQKAELLATKLSKSIRRQLISNLIDYYRVHIHGFKPTKSLEVMQTIFE